MISSLMPIVARQGNFIVFAIALSRRTLVFLMHRFTSLDICDYPFGSKTYRYFFVFLLCYIFALSENNYC